MCCTNGTSFTTVGLIEFDYISPKTLEIFGAVPDWVKYRDILLDLRPVNLARIPTPTT